jgi:hypothetical protein
MLLLAALFQPPTPTVPAVTRPAAELFASWESGRVPGGGVYAWFGVPAPADAVYAVLADDAAMASWIPHLARSQVVAPEPPCSRVAFAVPSPIGEVGYALHRCHDGTSVWWAKAEGERFDTIEGSYQLAAVPGGTLVRYWSHVVVAMPVPERVQDEVARIGVGDLVAGLRAEVARRRGGSGVGGG